MAVLNTSHDVNLKKPTAMEGNEGKEVDLLDATVVAKKVAL